MPFICEANGIQLMVNSLCNSICFSTRLKKQEVANTLPGTELSEEPLYFNIAEEKPVSWKVYLDSGKWTFFLYLFHFKLPYPSINTHSFSHCIQFDFFPRIILNAKCIAISHEFRVLMFIVGVFIRLCKFN